MYTDADVVSTLNEIILHETVIACFVVLRQLQSIHRLVSRPILQSLVPSLVCGFIINGNTTLTGSHLLQHLDTFLWTQPVSSTMLTTETTLCGLQDNIIKHSVNQIICHCHFHMTNHRNVLLPKCLPTRQVKNKQARSAITQYSMFVAPCRQKYSNVFVNCNEIRSKIINIR